MVKHNKEPVHSSNKAKPLVLITLIVVILIVALFVITTKQEEKAQEPARFSEQPSLLNQPTLGKDNAPVTVIEFGDYKCPSCKSWSARIYPQLMKDYIDAGKIKFAYINVLFHGEESQLASLAAESVFTQDPKAFWTYHKALYAAQPAQANHDETWITQQSLLEMAKANIPQIDLTKLEEDVKASKSLPELNIDSTLVEQYKVQLTPTIIINGIVMDDPFDYNKIKDVIDQELEDNNR
ncbi:DsbA family protein [Paenibacillus macquariensis]|uniref:Protein-disulfide isomerase n=1 Tax=Paenibacillus macquariensis TaxID=948756 RepID=A0ABY1JPN5_9BACL|nr:DsbA family protein [Paenibacillus macquariensis]MEC0094038.1 DsbA family protein [Paenibacillus macquariensis]OAB37504.1 dihydroneopterin aldolase [Paenibacillus macquariensis subsp. macquariensis]SIQ54950.1 Protein-disulfide isomerase [Paenibacillus macquariensis]